MQRFPSADWVDYRVQICGFFYSVPHQLIRKQIDTRATERSIEAGFIGIRTKRRMKRIKRLSKVLGSSNRGSPAP